VAVTRCRCCGGKICICLLLLLLRLLLFFFCDEFSGRRAGRREGGRRGIGIHGMDGVVFGRRAARGGRRGRERGRRRKCPPALA